MVQKVVPRGPKSSHALQYEGFLTTMGAEGGGKWCTRWCQEVQKRRMCCIWKALWPQWVHTSNVGENGARDAAKWSKLVTSAAL